MAPVQAPGRWRTGAIHLDDKHAPAQAPHDKGRLVQHERGVAEGGVQLHHHLLKVSCVLLCRGPRRMAER